MEEKIHSEASIIKDLRRYFNNGYTYRIDNAFIFGYDWESDFFCLNREGWSFEFEVKISRADFKNDLKKNRHKILYDIYSGKVESSAEKKRFPNRFYYAVPEGLITTNEVPEYAGLITVGNFANIIKRAPFIHRRKHDFRKILCDKFYHRWIEQLRRNNLLDFDHKSLREMYNRIQEKTKAA